MADNPGMPLHEIDEDAALRVILEGTAKETGERFFAALVRNLAAALQTHGAWVTEYLPRERRLRALAFWMGGDFLDNYEHDIQNTPCEAVIEEARLVHFPEGILTLYPEDPDLQGMGAVSYLGAPLLDLDGTVLGHLAVLDTRPMPGLPRAQAIFQIFAARAAAELRRLRAEEETRRCREKFERILSSAMDAIVQLDERLHVEHMNPAAERLFGAGGGGGSRDFRRALAGDGVETLARHIALIDTMPAGEQSVWIAGGLKARRADGSAFVAEATLARCDEPGRTGHTLVLRDVNDRIEAEARIRTLTEETEYLRAALRELEPFHETIGESRAWREVLGAVHQVAATDSTVLILGETGTGKELIARAIHRASGRADRPFIKVNCAAMPGTLIESEFFGHEAGAFTGAAKNREGRFALADTGTIFLDEAGELPLELQAKLLRVLQEGEFEALGSAITRKVDVRVIAATNRDLLHEVNEGRFRKDLYYRLNVFPITLPPLRARGDDVILLANRFAERFAKRMGRTFTPLTGACERRLRGYDWPGNVRELENLVERAAITSRDGRITLERVLPDTAPSAPPDAGPGADAVRTIQDLEDLERAAYLRAMEECGGRIAGPGGAAERVGLKPSTMRSRLKALGILQSK